MTDKLDREPCANAPCDCSKLAHYEIKGEKPGDPPTFGACKSSFCSCTGFAPRRGQDAA